MSTLSLRRQTPLDPLAIARAGVLVVLILVFTATDSRFFSVNNTFALLEGFALLGLAALAAGVTIMAGELDLSIGSVAAVAGILAVQTIEVGVIGAVLIAMAAGIAYGAAQGYAIYRLKVQSLVFTLGTLIALRGLSFVISNETTVVVPDVSVAMAVRTQYFIFSTGSVIAIAVFVLAWFFFRNVRLGREIMAIGGGRSEAVAAGVPLRRPLVLTFAISGGLAALAGALSSIKSGSASPGGFDGLLLPAVTAAIVGGVTLAGGKGTVGGIAVGVLILRCLNNGFSLQGWPIYLLTLATGTLLAVVVLIELVLPRWTRSRRPRDVPARE